MAVRLAARARTDLEEIWLHIAADSLGMADRFLDSLFSTFELLDEAEFAARARPELAPTSEASLTETT